MSTSTEYMDGLNAPAERRFYPRVTPPTPIYVAFGANNLGVLCNVSENGFQVSTPDDLPLNSVYRVSLALNGTPKTIVVAVRTVWSNDAQKRSGIQLLDLSDEDRQHIRKWVVFELTRSENPNARQVPKNGERPSLTRKPMDVNPADQSAAPRQHDLGAAQPPQHSAAFAPNQAAAFAPAPAPTPVEVREELLEEAAAEVSPSTAPANTNPSPVPNAETAPVAPASLPAFFAETPNAAASPAPPPPDPAPAETQPAAVSEADLPKIANPFDEPDPNAQFTSPFPPVPLPIHGEFEYATPPPKIRRNRNWSSQLRTRPLIIWAAALALLCFGANALVRYKIKRNSQRFASESAGTAPANQSDSASSSSAPASSAPASSAPASSDNSDANSTSSPGTDSQASNSGVDTASNDQPPSSASAPATVAPDDRQTAAIPAPSHSVANKSDAAPPTQPRRESSLDASDNRAYSATAPPSSDRSEQIARSSQPAATPRTWSAPAPSPSSSAASQSNVPQSPSVMSSSNNTPLQSTPAPVVAQTRPTPPSSPVQTSSSNNSSNPISVSNSNSPASTPPSRTQTPSPSSSQSSTYAANTNPAPALPQSPIYNANAPAQRSAIIGSINSVHSSGIFDSNDSTTTTSSSTAPPPAATRGSSNVAVATRSVSNTSVVSTDAPQERDLEIAAPKGFKDSYVDLPGEHVVRSAAGTVHIRRSVHVGGERIPGQRWLWRGKLNVTLGDVVNRIDPSVVQASGASGSLTVQATIDKDGYVTDLKPLYGNFAMLPSVSRTVRNWRYEPTYLDSKRAETQAQIEFDLHPATASSSANRTTHP